MIHDWKLSELDTVGDVFSELGKEIVLNAKRHGFDSLQHEAIGISLMHAELSECLEAYREGNPPSEHIPQYSAVEEELADVIIRVLDHATARHFKIAEAVLAKMKYNEDRPVKHGGKRY
jgi:NTP pyrophosphatase (non-canonical NTP hydrolase)